MPTTPLSFFPAGTEVADVAADGQLLLGLEVRRVFAPHRLGVEEHVDHGLQSGDGAAGRITNMPEANQYLTREYRKGWEL